MDWDLTKTQALEVLQNARNPRSAYELFAQASELRDRKLGKRLWWSSGSGGLFPCSVKPRCAYCSFHTERMFPTDVLLNGLELIESLGVRQFHISGGTDLDRGYDEPLLELVRTIKARSGLKLEINLGPSFRRETVLELKNLGIDSITSSLECNAPRVFAAAKPGDNLERRRQLLRFCEEADVPSRSMMLIGLGETDKERIDHLFFLKQFKKLYQLRISRFMPFPGTAYMDKYRCSPWELALTTAVARLVLQECEICPAAGNGTDDIPLWYLAGGGNQLLGVSITRKTPQPAPGTDVYHIGGDAYVVDKRQGIEKLLEGMGLEATNEIPAQLRA
ncbi:biotin synthase [Sporobacter termitidis DSM 10068]|uniref:biotin synthase n=1 Tax=Sporobacter termitidis DSM 10068 TaxID=1123282 RepID=A0A1M5WI18_9FIRM|nr:radical SAM protein [Sporobacter termitidis]SHH87199.1 biotin synthase [Sporobacter termitidis DSM 10068]